MLRLGNVSALNGSARRTFVAFEDANSNASGGSSRRSSAGAAVSSSGGDDDDDDDNDSGLNTPLAVSNSANSSRRGSVSPPPMTAACAASSATTDQRRASSGFDADSLAMPRRGSALTAPQTQPNQAPHAAAAVAATAPRAEAAAEKPASVLVVGAVGAAAVTPGFRPFDFLGVVTGTAARDFGKMKAGEQGGAVNAAGTSASSSSSASIARFGASAKFGGGGGAYYDGAGFQHQQLMQQQRQSTEERALEERVQAVLARERHKEEVRRLREAEQLQRDAKEIEGWMSYHKREAAKAAAAAAAGADGGASGGAGGADRSQLLPGQNPDTLEIDDLFAFQAAVAAGAFINDSAVFELSQSTRNAAAMSAYLRMRRKSTGGLGATLSESSGRASMAVTVENLRRYPNQAIHVLAQGGPAKALAQLRNLSPSRGISASRRSGGGGDDDDEAEEQEGGNDHRGGVQPRRASSAHRRALERKFARIEAKCGAKCAAERRRAAAAVEAVKQELAETSRREEQEAAEIRRRRAAELQRPTFGGGEEADATAEMSDQSPSGSGLGSAARRASNAAMVPTSSASRRPSVADGAAQRGSRRVSICASTPPTEPDLAASLSKYRSPFGESPVRPGAECDEDLAFDRSGAVSVDGDDAVDEEEEEEEQAVEHALFDAEGEDDDDEGMLDDAAAFARRNTNRGRSDDLDSLDTPPSRSRRDTTATAAAAAAGQQQQQRRGKGGAAHHSHRDPERELREVEWRLTARVIFTNMIVCEHDESMRRNALLEEQEAHWQAHVNFFAHGCERARIVAMSKRLFGEMLDERDAWLRDWRAEADALRADFVAGRAAVRRRDLNAMLQQCDKATREMLLAKSEQERDAFLDLVMEERWLKAKVKASSSLKKRLA